MELCTILSCLCISCVYIQYFCLAGVTCHSYLIIVDVFKRVRHMMAFVSDERNPGPTNSNILPPVSADPGSTTSLNSDNASMHSLGFETNLWPSTTDISSNGKNNFAVYARQDTQSSGKKPQANGISRIRSLFTRSATKPLLAVHNKGSCWGRKSAVDLNLVLKIPRPTEARSF